jgi:uncharacterized protein YneF (UPF0154 family)
MNLINIVLIILSLITVASGGIFIYLNMKKKELEKNNNNDVNNLKKYYKNKESKVNEVASRIKGMEVYHIYNNTHTYPMAKEKCKMYGGRLATEAEVRRAYKDGANWCNYGWSHGQKILFPAQKQAVDFEEAAISLMNPKKCGLVNNNKCQKVGVNGGFYPNPNLEVGVNCYGLRPEFLDNDEKLRVKDDKKRKKLLEKIRKNDMGRKNELLKRKNLEKLKENVRKSIANDMISDYNSVVNKTDYEMISNDKLKFFEDQETEFP